ncbi:Cation/H+ exchanger [Kalmanozyma brasiliensis GHG001]|uniref:Sodium/hydrogen exchanger n=1 Tax=Kalmanozyma brasiliensis (strain GHG001) TaxID=1365824 RepID=V5GQ37_KALBG|nr:Cation/H+ exchanger [Kalmanozyma brasiliensis GHG001]EST08042.1 Cation/H+ exchanger [Kalmanozyma brasiliensis GHG001]
MATVAAQYPEKGTPTLAPSPTTVVSTVIATPTETAEPLPIPDAEQAERDSSIAIFLVLTLLILSFLTSYYLKVKRITAVHETIVGLFAGMFVGVCLRIGPGEDVQAMLSFSNSIMLNVLLPPIILASGYDLRQENFFRNFGTILVFAFAGTVISAVVIGVIVYLWSLLQLESISLTLLECLIFGSTLSATDPVTILAIFNTYKVDPKLYSIIFGESILNDAVSIVMFDVLSTFRGKEIYVSSVFHGIGLFLVVFTVSMFLGVCFGLACSLMLKHSRLGSFPQLESCLVVLIAYMSYFFSNGVTMSGIVSLLFCGITLKHYAYHNMSHRTQRTTRYTFQTLANLSENFIFIYLGLSLFTQDYLVYKPLLIIVTVLAVVISRYCAVFPIAGAVNAFKRTRNNRRARATGGGGVPRGSGEEELPRQYQIMLFWAGLRGAVGFALSAGIEGDNSIPLQTTVLVTVVLTVIVFGGTTAQMLEILGIRTGVQDDEGESDDDEDQDDVMRLRGMARRTYMDSGSYRDASERAGLTRQGKRYPSGLKGDYRDGSDPPTPRDSLSAPHSRQHSLSSSVYARNNSSGAVTKGGINRGGFADDLEEEDDPPYFSSENLPSGSSTPGIGTGDLSPLSPMGSGFQTPSLAHGRSASTPYAGTQPSLSEIRRAVQEASSADGTTSSPAKQLLDRAGLVMKDGQWFQAIDQKYLLPLFSNSVASRKHEERKTARLAARDAAALDPLSADASVGGARRSFFSVEEDGDADLYPAERDAVVVDEDDDDATTPVIDATSTFASARSRSGASTPTRRSFFTGDGDISQG